MKQEIVVDVCESACSGAMNPRRTSVRRSLLSLDRYCIGRRRSSNIWHVLNTMLLIWLGLDIRLSQISCPGDDWIRFYPLCRWSPRGSDWIRTRRSPVFCPDWSVIRSVSHRSPSDKCSRATAMTLTMRNRCWFVDLSWHRSRNCSRSCWSRADDARCASAVSIDPCHCRVYLERRPARERSSRCVLTSHWYVHWSRAWVSSEYRRIHWQPPAGWIWVGWCRWVNSVGKWSMATRTTRNNGSLTEWDLKRTRKRPLVARSPCCTQYSLLSIVRPFPLCLRKSIGTGLGSFCCPARRLLSSSVW